MFKYISLIFLTFFSNLLAQSPKVSVITYLNNANEFIQGYLNDISKQTIFNECELILINCNDKGLNIDLIKKFSGSHTNIKFYDLNKNYTVFEVLNYAIQISKAEFISNFNVQDRFKHDLLETHYNELKKNCHIDLVYSGYYITYNKNETFEKNHYRWTVTAQDFCTSKMNCYLPGPAPMWRKGIHKKVGYFDTSLKFSSNWQMWLKAVENGSEFKKIDGTYCLHFDSDNLAQEQKEQVGKENSLISEKYYHVWQKVKIKENKNFVIIIPSYNNKYWYQRNLQSVLMQKYQNYRIIYIDDCSSDYTADLVENFADLMKIKNFQLIKNKERKGALENLYNAIHSCANSEIIVTLDGDDWFVQENVLDILNQSYQNDNVWLTYGQFIYYPSGGQGWAQQVPQQVIQKNDFRNNAWTTTHLRTFYAGLFKKIKKEDLMHENKFFPMAWDLAFMYPMLEMAGDRSKFIAETLYAYNTVTPINDHKVDPNLQITLTQVIRNKDKYNKIDNLFSASNKISIFASQWGDIFNINSQHNRDDCLRPTYDLKRDLEKLVYEIDKVDNLINLENNHKIVCFNIDRSKIEELKKYPKEKLILFLWEPKTTNPDNYDVQLHKYFGKIYTWNDELVDNKQYFKFYYPVLNKIGQCNEFNARQLCTMICMNKNSSQQNELYSLRHKVIQYFETKQSQDFKFYGMFWPENKYKNYKGHVNTKFEVLNNYLFCFCFENTKDVPGYVTEKIFDCFKAGCIPIYLGAKNISAYVPKNCYIDFNDFKNLDELYGFMKNFGENKWYEYRKRIENYLESDKAQLFSINNFIKTFKEACDI